MQIKRMRRDPCKTCNEHADDTEGGAARLADYACKQMAAVPVPASFGLIEAEEAFGGIDRRRGS